MIRLEAENGWWLVTHPEHARLAGCFAEHWGNALFSSPEPRASVLLGIARHDDGWAARDAMPHITRAGLPSAFSTDLVGKYAAFEEIDLVDYLVVRERAVAEVAGRDAYAALLISMHTYNLLTDRADRSTIVPLQLPLLDAFLERQRALQQALQSTLGEQSRSQLDGIEDNFRLLQATDNLSLLACTDYGGPATLLHPLRLLDGEAAPVEVDALGQRAFRLRPWPFREDRLQIHFASRFVEGRSFASKEVFQDLYFAASQSQVSVTLMR